MHAPRSSRIRSAGPTIVGIGDFAAVRAPGDIITHGLGSCVAVTAYDPKARVAGLLHVLLPSSKLDPARAAEEPGVFADTGVAALAAALLGLGSRLDRCVVRIAGGASLFRTTTMDIGRRNVLAIQRVLWAHRVRLASEDVGGNVARTVQIDGKGGAVHIRIPGKPEILR